jgi:hypothetical protein
MKQKRQLAGLIALLIIAAAVWGWYFRRGQLAAPTETVSAAPNYRLLAVENPQIRFEEIEKARQAEYKSTGRNIFSAVALPAPASHSGSADPAKIVWNTPCGVKSGPCPEPPPPPPQLPANVKFFGYGTGPNGTSRRAFFHDTNGDEVYIVNEGQLLLNRFRILKIGNASLEFEEVSSGRKGTAPLEEQAAGPSA